MKDQVAWGAGVRKFLLALTAVLVGNAIYFLLLAPHLPGWARHTPFALDAGLLIDLVVCLGIYAGLGPLLRRGRHSS
jgi:hypothetical protein